MDIVGLIPATAEAAPYIIAQQIFALIGAIIMYRYIRHKQKIGEFKGTDSLPRAIIFTIFVFGTVALWIIIWENWLVPWIF